MLRISEPLATQLAQKRVHVETPDDDTLILRGVPISGEGFNKPRTNLLVKRPGRGMPFVACVDADLAYQGNNRRIGRLLAGSVEKQGWRPLYLPLQHRGARAALCDMQPVLESALSVVGFAGRKPSPPLEQEKPESAPPSLLAEFGADLTAEVAGGGAEPTVGRERELEDATACLLRWGQARSPALVGGSGVGKTNLLYAIARRLSECRPDLRLIRVDVVALLHGTLFEAERERLFRKCLEEARAAPNGVLALEQAALVAEQGWMQGLIAEALDAGGRMVLTMLPQHQQAFSAEQLNRRLDFIRLAEPHPALSVRMLAALRPTISAHHRVEILESCLGLCVREASSLPGLLPAKAIKLLDAAAAHAALGGAHVLGPDDILSTGARLTLEARPQGPSS